MWCLIYSPHYFISIERNEKAIRARSLLRVEDNPFPVEHSHDGKNDLYTIPSAAKKKSSEAENYM